MRSSGRTTAGAAALLMLLGFLCPTICLGDGGATPGGHATRSVEASPPCHDAAPEAPTPGGSAPSSGHSDCTHCESAATLASVDGSVDHPDLGVARRWLLPVWSPVAFTGRISARAHDPPPRNLLLVKSSFLL